MKNISQPVKEKVRSGLRPTDNWEALATSAAWGWQPGQGPELPGGTGPLPCQPANLSRLQFVGDGQNRHHWPALLLLPANTYVCVFDNEEQENKTKKKKKTHNFK